MATRKSNSGLDGVETIDKAKFAVDTRLVWVAAGALILGANYVADWRNKVENFMIQQAEINKDAKSAPARIQKVESDMETIKADMASVKSSLTDMKDGIAAIRTSVGRIAPSSGDRGR